MAPNNIWRLFTGHEQVIGGKYKAKGLLDVATDWNRAGEKGVPLGSDVDDVIKERVWEFVSNTFLPGQAGRAIDVAGQLVTGRVPRSGRGISPAKYESFTQNDVQDVVGRLVRRYGRDKDTQIKLLRDMVSGALESYKNEKYLAGESGRLGLKWEKGATDVELLDSDRARENWHILLRSIERKVDSFRTLTKGNFTDQEINTMMKNFGELRTSERKHIIDGTVNDMTGEDFQFEHTPMPTQRGDAEVIEYFNENEVINYKDIHAMLVKDGFVPGKYGRGFRTRIKKLRKEWRQQ
jgi:hypothetical protein